MFHVWTLLPAVYVYLRFIRLLGFSKKVKFLSGLVVVAGCEFHLISRLIFGTMFSPELPQPVMVLQGWVFGCTIFLALMLLLQDICFVFCRVFLRRAAAGRSGVRMVMLAAASLLSAAGVYNAVKVPAVHRTELTLQKLPREFDGFTLVQLTDLHASRLLTRSWMQSVMEKTNALHPDLIVVTGDMADGTVTDRRGDVSPLASLKAPYGVYAITGNHEYYFNADAWVKEYTRLGLRFLSNSHVLLTKHNASIVLAGVNDDVAPEYGGTGPDLRKALSGVSPEDEAVILLDHRPGNAADAAIAGVSLQLSGHTHGGMIRGLDIAAGPANNGFVSGLYQVGDTALYVSNGAGLWNGFPLRLGKPSEITVITLRAKR
ncbi:serine/threonine protein phosphatase [Pantoea vagans]|uniref:metallophosphoesterase n=1 Tax=Pantoea vagans TaxID=470934 RepID=UPI000BAC7139|nr:metallophosphoesterase [Pantoea vagans]PAW33621.1 serine/threonine protein phosphatase [Pantoea vagans]